jgi:pantoate kinase
MRTAVAFAPGHISGFFQPITDSNDLDKIGSRGAGVCISHGVTATVKATKGKKQRITIKVNEKSGRFPVTLNAIKTVLGQGSYDVNVDVTMDLPVGQGFGMSAASALSSSLAMTTILDEPCALAIQAAHHAEVTFHTGLGDVCSAAVGGFEIRKKPGIAPFNDIQKIAKQQSILLGLFPGNISTKRILTDNIRLNHISAIGEYCIDQVIQSPSVESIMKYSYYFTMKSGLAPKKILLVLEQINKQCPASMCMLGHSIFVLGYDEEIKQLINKKAILKETTVDTIGARVLETSF